MEKPFNRYKRIIELGWERHTLQEALVIVVGAGALGNEVLKNLALLGVGRIIVVDMDVIEDHNLTRTILFDQNDIGKYKATVAAEKVMQINSDVEVVAFLKPVQEVLGLGIYRQADLVFGCLDNIQARIDVNRYCYQTKTPYIDAGLRKLDGDVKVLGGDFEQCLDCTLNHTMREEAWRRFSCLKLRSRLDDNAPTLPTSPTIASIMAGFQVQIGVKILHGMTVKYGNRISVFGNIDELNTSQLPSNPECPTHNLYDPIPLDRITNLPHRSNELTVARLIEIIERDLNAPTAIRLDYDLITYFKCSEHQYKIDRLGRRGSFYVDEVECPHCNAEGKTQTQAIMREKFINQIDQQTYEGIQNKTLQEIGIPLGQIFEAKVRHEDYISYHYYEMTGDEQFWHRS
ncbi:MAG: HesA/MoeB/ThiF family protein [Chitinophagales bacterium]